MFTGHYSSPLGTLTLTSDGTALTGLWFDGQRFAPSAGAVAEEATAPANDIDTMDIFMQTRRWLDLYFSGTAPSFTPPLNAVRGATPFRRAVWDELLAIPYGHTVTYGTLAQRLATRLGRPSMSAQAIGGAVGHNPIALIIPCHRVIGADGSLTGYAAGINRKRLLLQGEKPAAGMFAV